MRGAINRKPNGSRAFGMACMAGSLYPDIDSVSSKLGRKVKSLSILFTKVFGHRGFIHSPVNGILLYLAIYAFTQDLIPDDPYCIAAGFLFGFMLHLIQDSFTRGGIPWLYPVCTKKIRFARFRSDSPWCFVITAVLAVLIAGFFLWFVPMSQMPMLI